MGYRDYYKRLHRDPFPGSLLRAREIMIMKPSPSSTWRVEALLFDRVINIIVPSRIPLQTVLALLATYAYQVPTLQVPLHTHRPQSSSFLGFIFGNPKKELFWGLWVDAKA